MPASSLPSCRWNSEFHLCCMELLDRQSVLNGAKCNPSSAGSFNWFLEKFVWNMVSPLIQKRLFWSATEQNLLLTEL